MTDNSLTEPCVLCGHPSEQHPHCDGCGIAIGPGHLETTTTPFTVYQDGKASTAQLCPWCLDAIERHGFAIIRYVARGTLGSSKPMVLMADGTITYSLPDTP